MFFICFAVLCELIKQRKVKYTICDNYVVYFNQTFCKKNVVVENFKRIAGVIVCLWSYNFSKRARQFICYFLDVQDSHNPLSYQYHSWFCYVQKHLLIKLVKQQAFVHQSGSDNKIVLRNCQCKS